jgi:tetratricopeptide (TPR) repeat protein
LLAQLTALLARIEKDRANSEVASTPGTSALDLDEIKPVWAAERRVGVSTLFAVARAPGASPATTQALAALQNGNVNGLQGWLNDQETAALARTRKETGSAAAAARTAALQAARQQGALALGFDNQAALAAFRRAIELDSDDYWTHITIGDLLAQVNDPGGAAASYQTAAAVLRATVLGEPAGTKPATAGQPLSHVMERRVLMVCEYRQGEALVSADDREAALRAFQRALVPAETLMAAEPAAAERLFEVATVSDRVAELLAALNQWQGALAAHERSLALAEALAASDKDNEAQWEFYIKDKIEHVADLQLALGQPDVALTNYKRGLELGEKLVAINVNNDAWLSSTLGLIAKVGGSAGMAQTGEERRQLLLRGLELLGRVRSGEVWDNSDEWGDRLRQALDELPNPSDEIEQSQ